ncbi:hypothetical protein OH76DRAFT_279672 [Lentinus brumalis]|uniref:Uncharacterized protein n=1 Tax=Lentinus brumalis TaxID=2498619 RepID=A0A371CKX6_9APHY|nr:hypothetical protein OH76DRAFT_279672 [Polyporus brumalis]
MKREMETVWLASWWAHHHRHCHHHLSLSNDHVLDLPPLPVVSESQLEHEACSPDPLVRSPPDPDLKSRHSFAFCPPPLLTRHSSFVTPYSSIVNCHSLFAFLLFLYPRGRSTCPRQVGGASWIGTFCACVRAYVSVCRGGGDVGVEVKMQERGDVGERRCRRCKRCRLGVGGGCPVVVVVVGEIQDYPGARACRAQ